MPAIRILPDVVANQIAAGEVIERPAAVVKELIENSLDAGARRIEIEFSKGGKNLIRVEDNGYGMSPDDALLSLERHGTSKIREAADLLKIGSYGFRGEALPSIASVSRFTLRTRTEERPHGTEIFVNGGRLVHAKECGMPGGTQIEVAHLFHTVPARRKFLKTDNTEAAHIVHLSRLFAVANPNTSFTLLENGRTLFRSPVCQSLRERVGEIFGRQIASQLIEIEAEEEDYKLTGLIGKPGVGRATRHELVTYVNRRPVDSRTLNFALIEAYHTYIPKGRYPLAFVFLEVDPAKVDVNVHPAKREVRFREEGRLRHFFIRAVLDRLREAATVSAVGVASEEPKPTPINLQARAVPDFGKGLTGISSSPATVSRPIAPGAPIQLEKGNVDGAPVAVPPEPFKIATPAMEGSLNWRYFGTAHGSYVVFETDNGLVLLNWRGARGRIFYEDILAGLEGKSQNCQKLLFPIAFELDALASAALEEHLDFFQSNGFEIEQFGRNYYRIESLPDWLDPGLGEGFARDLLSLLRERGLNPNRPEPAREEIARLASDRLAQTSRLFGQVEPVRLAERLMTCRNPLNDHRGRPTFFEISWGDLEKKFGK